MEAIILDNFQPTPLANHADTPYLNEITVKRNQQNPTKQNANKRTRTYTARAITDT